MTDDTAAGLEARLQRLEDLQEIHQLFVDYGRYIDRGDFAAFAGLFCEDGELRIGPVGKAKGRAEIQAMMEKTISGGGGKSIHLIGSPSVELDGDTATSEVMWTVLAKTENGVAVTMTGRHVDELVRDGGRWRIRRRKGLLDLPDVFPGR